MLDALVAEARDRWGMDVSAGIQIVTAEGLTATPIEASQPLLVLPRTWLEAGAAGGERQAAGTPTVDVAPSSARGHLAGAPLPGRHGAEGRDPVRLLRRLYPADATVARLGTASATTTIAELTLGDLDGALYLAPIAPELAAAGPWAMPYISNRLRQPDGCPWDREQTHDSLRKHLLEETYEVYDALEHGATPALAEELGDLFLQVVLHAQLAAEAGVFDLADVQASIARKIVRRHPHVFGDAVARTSADVNRQWERIKADERESAALESAGLEAAAEVAGGAGPAAGAVRGAPPVPKSALDGISPSMPALAAGQEIQERAAALGYDWPGIEGVLDKLVEELGELARAETTADRREEFGDLLLVAVNVGRKMGIEAEAALRGSNAKFRSRFARVERMARERGAALRDLDFAALDHLWDAAKAEERAAAADPPPAVTSEGVR